MSSIIILKNFKIKIGDKMYIADKVELKVVDEEAAAEKEPTSDPTGAEGAKVDSAKADEAAKVDSAKADEAAGLDEAAAAEGADTRI
jgi:hypothetical protein